MAMAGISSDSQSEIDSRMTFLQKLYADLLRNAATETSRNEYKQLKNKLEGNGIEYNEVARWRRKLRQIIGGFKKKMRSLEEKMKKDLGELMRKNLELEARNAELEEETKKVRKDLTTRNAELEVQRAMSSNLEKNVKNQLAEIKTKVEGLHEKVEGLHEKVTASNETLAEIRNVDLENVQGDLQINAKNIIEIQDKVLGVKLFVMYNKDKFSPDVSCPEVQSSGKCWDLHFIRCEVGDLKPGWAPFEAVRNALRPFFPRPETQNIYQWQSFVEDRAVSLVTSLADDEEEPILDSFCSSDGCEFRRREAKDDGQWIKEGGRIFIAGGRRRTVLQIS